MLKGLEIGDNHFLHCLVHRDQNRTLAQGQPQQVGVYRRQWAGALVHGAIPSTPIFQDELAYAFADIAPKAPLHVLILPREHISSTAEADRRKRAVLGHLLWVASEIARNKGARPLPIMGELLSIFADKDDWQKAFSFGSVNSYLQNKMPKDLPKSKPQEVLRAAEIEAAGVQHR